jgi:hypothetical protein
VSIWLRWLTRRAAPPVVRSAVARSDRPADAWEPVDPSWGERLAVGVDSSLIRMADAAARGTSRRDFLAWTGALGLAVGAGAGTALFRPGAARAHGLPCDDDGSACGPSPLCSGTYCTSTNCAAGRADTARRTYAGTGCTSSTSNCWTEHCCAQAFNGHARCCDCCAPSSGLDCTGSGCPNRRCICRSRIDTC